MATKATLMTDLGELLNFTSGVVDSDFTEARLLASLNRAYRREVRKAKLEGFHSWFLTSGDLTWTASSQTLDISSTSPSLVGVDIYVIRDVTDDTTGPGYQMSIGENGEFFWKDRQTWQWVADGGPASAKTLRVTYYESPTDMSADGDVPDLIPAEHHEILVWSAACDLRKIADEATPTQWFQELTDLRLDMHKELSRGRPVREPIIIGHSGGGTRTEDTFSPVTGIDGALWQDNDT